MFLFLDWIGLLSHQAEILKGDSFVSLGKNHRIMTLMTPQVPTRLLETFTLTVIKKQILLVASYYY